MKHNHGQEIVLNRFRLLTQNLLARLGLALFLAFGVVVVSYVLWAPPEALKNVIGYGGRHLVLAVKREAPTLLKLGADDFGQAAAYTAKLESQANFWTGLTGLFLLVTALAFILLTVLFRVKGKDEQADQFKRGSRLLTVKEHNRLMGKTYGESPPHNLGAFLTLGREGAMVPEALSFRHFAFVGASGYGKSTTIEELMAQAIAYGHKGLVLDVKGSYYAKFGRPGDRILSLYDQRSEAWDFWHEPLATPEKMAAAMIQETSDHNQFFWKGARAFLASLLRGNQSVYGLWEDFNKPMKEIRAKLAATKELSRRIVGDNDGEQGDAIVGTTVLDFGFLRDLGYWTKGKTPFSLTRWMNDNQDRAWVFVIVNESDIEITQPLLRVWFDLAALAALERDDTDVSNVHTWLIVDELKSVGKLPSLPAILDKGRKYKTSVVVGYQANTQLEALYGAPEAENILQGLQNQFFYRMSSPKAAEDASTLLGDEEVLQAVDGVSFGVDAASDRGTISRQYTKKRLVLPDALRNQDILRCYAKLCHHMPIELHFAPMHYPRRNLASVCAYPPPLYQPEPERAELTTPRPLHRSGTPRLPEEDKAPEPQSRAALGEVSAKDAPETTPAQLREASPPQGVLSLFEPT